MIERCIVVSTPANATPVFLLVSPQSNSTRMKQVSSGPYRKIYVVTTGPAQKVHFVS